MKVLVIGGGAGGAGAAARVRRLNEDAEITIYERSGFASYSNCGLPYNLSDEIPKFAGLIMTTPEELKNQYKLNVKVKHEVIAIDPIKKELTIKDILGKKEFTESFDKLIIAAGAAAVIPPIDGVNSKHVFTLKTPDDVKKITSFIDKAKPKNFVIVGGGAIGLEIAENLVHAGYKNVAVVDEMDRLMSRSLDMDFASYLHKSAVEAGINLILKRRVVKINKSDVELCDGSKIKADVVFMNVGVRPELKMFKEAGFKIGQTGGLVVNNKQRTNFKDIYAVGDLAETKDHFGNPSRIALAFPASRQAVVAANNLSKYRDEKGKPDTYKGVTGSSTLSLFDVTIASTGMTEAALIEKGINYNKTINARGANIGPVRGGGNVFLKVLYNDKGIILGAQSAGPKSAEKRVSYISLAMQNNMKFRDFEDFMVAYSPTVDTTYDATTMAARLARHVADGTLAQVFPEELVELQAKGYTLIDVREKHEMKLGMIEGALAMPLSSFREDIKDLDKDGKYIIHCKTGARSYNAGLVLRANGFTNVYNLAGGYDHYVVYRDFKVVGGKNKCAKITSCKSCKGGK